MPQTYKDPTFDEVARREARRQRKAKIRASRWYRVMKRRRIKKLLSKQMNRKYHVPVSRSSIEPRLPLILYAD